MNIVVYGLDYLVNQLFSLFMVIAANLLEVFSKITIFMHKVEDDPAISLMYLRVNFKYFMRRDLNFRDDGEQRGKDVAD